MKNGQVILTVTAHPDDEVLGFGASAAKLVKDGCKVINCMLSGSVEARTFRPDLNDLYSDINSAQNLMGCDKAILGNFPNIKFNTVPHLDLVQYIESVIEKVNPDYIFTHFANDLNNDHCQVSKACQAAARLFQRRKMKRLKGLFFMEILSSTDWAFKGESNGFIPDTFIEVGEANVLKKMKALECYRGVMRNYPHPRSVEVIKGLAALRGSQVGVEYAEGFMSAFNVLEF